MRSSHTVDRLDVTFDDDRLVADAGLLLPATLAHHLDLRGLVDTHLDLGVRPGQANRGDKLLSLVMSALGGGDCIDDANALRAGGTERILGFSVKPASTLGTFLRSFRWGPRPPARPGQPGTARPSLGGRRRTRLGSAHDRSRLDDLRDVRPPEAGCAP